MASIKKRHSDGSVLVEYRRDGKALYWPAINEVEYQNYCAVAETLADAGKPVPAPEELGFRSAPNRRRRRAAGATSQRVVEPIDSLDSSGPEDESAHRQSYRDWIGTPKAPGEFFEKSRRKGDTTRAKYFALSDKLGAASGMPQKDVSLDEGRRTVHRWLVCPACVDRARKQRRTELIENAHEKLRATETPWDQRKGEQSPCVDEDGESDHFPGHRRETILSWLRCAAAAWSAAMQADIGLPPDDPRRTGITSNPWKTLLGTGGVPLFADRPNDYDLSEALSHGQLDLLEHAFPAWLQASIPVGTAGMLRPQELYGLRRGAITWPTEPKDLGQARLRIKEVYLKNGKIRTTGKTLEATTNAVTIGRYSTGTLRAHVTEHRSTPSPNRCDACRDGIREVPTKNNPHRRCDFANDAPVWVDPRNGKRITPWGYARLYADAATAAGLTSDVLGWTISPRSLRSSGATLAIEAGSSFEDVKIRGRWASEHVLKKNYYRQRNAHVTADVELFEVRRRQELGIDCPGIGGAQPEALANRIQHLEAQVTLLRKRLLANNLSDDVVVPIEPPLVGMFANDEKLTHLILTCASRREILLGLGVAATKKNYRLLERRAEELGLALPEKWRRAS